MVSYFFLPCIVNYSKKLNGLMKTLHSYTMKKYVQSHLANWISLERGRRGRDHMVVGVTTTYAISAYHHRCCEFESRSGRGVQHYVIKLVSDLRQVGGFFRILRFPSSIKLTATI